MSILDEHVVDVVVSGEDRERRHILLAGGRASGCYRRRGRWAITRTGVRALRGYEESALSEYLDVLRARGLRPLFTDVPDPDPYVRRGLFVHRYADEAVMDLVAADQTGFDLIAGLRYQLLAERVRLTATPYRAGHCAAVTKITGGAPSHGNESWVAVNESGTVHGVASWATDDGAPVMRRGLPEVGERDQREAARTLSAMAVHPGAPLSTVELLLIHAVSTFRERGVTTLYLGRRARAPWWTPPGNWTTGTMSDNVDNCGPRRYPRWVALPSAWQLPAAALVLRRSDAL